MDSLERTQPDPVRGVRPTTDPAREPRRLGEFRILRRLGEGGMGTVYLAYHEGTDKQLALKVLAQHLSDNQSYVDRFYREAKNGALLNHPSIVHCFGAHWDGSERRHYLVLEYVDGETAHTLLDHYKQLSVGDAIHIALDVARALEHAHSRNVIHRDIKPDNILITRSGVSKLADLGLAKRTDEASHLTATRQGFGTSFYMPYEQALNAKHADGRSDIYALGATLYHLITGQVPFPGDNHLDVVEKKDLGEFTPASRINQTVPRVLDQILSRMLARNPRDRYQTASELIVDLERSRLAAPVPSYADPDLALQDPYVRACLASSAQPTQPDLSLNPAQETPMPPDSDAPPAEPQWTVRYPAKDGRWRRVKMNAAQLRQRIEEGRVPARAEVSGDPREGFSPLAEHPAFRELLAKVPVKRVARVRRTRPSSPSPKAVPQQPRGGPSLSWRLRWWVALAALFVFLLALYFAVLRG
jgi:serine/threonine-protein kinase